MGKRSCTSNLIELEYEEGALRSSKRRALQVASNTAAMSLLALRTKPPTALSEDAIPLNKQLFPLQPQRQAKAVNYSVSSITDDEDDNRKKQVVASKKRPDVFRVGPSLTQLALRKPILSTAGTRRREAPNHQKLPFGRPLPPAPLLPYLLMSRRVIPSTTNKS
jgi:hypothetical protein